MAHYNVYMWQLPSLWYWFTILPSLYRVNIRTHEVIINFQSSFLYAHAVLLMSFCIFDHYCVIRCLIRSCFVTFSVASFSIILMTRCVVYLFPVLWLWKLIMTVSSLLSTDSYMAAVKHIHVNFHGYRPTIDNLPPTGAF